MADRSYRPGRWFAVLGPHVVLLLPESEKPRVAALWSLADDGAGLDEVLDALLAGGLRTLPCFALVGRRDPDRSAVTALLRGPVAGSFTADGEVVAVDGASAATWVERTFPTVQALSLVADPTVAGPDLPVGPGLLRAARVDQPAVAEPEDPVAAAEPTVEPVSEPMTEPVVVLPEEPVEPERPVEPAAAPPLPPPPGPPGYAGDHDGLTGIGLAAPLAQEAPPPLGRPVALLVFSTGDTVEVDRPVVIGRAPEARRFDAAEQPRLVPVPSPHQEISGTHLEVRPGVGADHGLAVVTDLGSTNGTIVVLPGLEPEALRPGIPVQLLPGSLIDLGDGVSIQVTTP